jgi:hypothetical protein
LQHTCIATSPLQHMQHPDKTYETSKMKHMKHTHERWRSSMPTVTSHRSSKRRIQMRTERVILFLWSPHTLWSHRACTGPRAACITPSEWPHTLPSTQKGQVRSCLTVTARASFFLLSHRAGQGLSGQMGILNETLPLI